MVKDVLVRGVLGNWLGFAVKLFQVPHLIGACLHSLLVQLKAVRLLG